MIKCERSGGAHSRQRAKDSETDKDRPSEKERREELVIAFVARNRCRDQPAKVNRIADVIFRTQVDKMLNAFKQRVDDIDGRKKAEDKKERAMVRVVMFFVIDEFIELTLRWK